jgi:hypothetical protein
VARIAPTKKPAAEGGEEPSSGQRRSSTAGGANRSIFAPAVAGRRAPTSAPDPRSVGEGMDYRIERGVWRRLPLRRRVVT